MAHHKYNKNSVSEDSFFQEVAGKKMGAYNTFHRIGVGIHRTTTSAFGISQKPHDNLACAPYGWIHGLVDYFIG
jgi:hypothetical protein